MQQPMQKPQSPVPGTFGQAPQQSGLGAMLGQLGMNLLQTPSEQLAAMGPPPQMQMPAAPQGPGMAMVGDQYKQLLGKRPPPMGVPQTQGEARTSVGAALGGF